MTNENEKNAPENAVSDSSVSNEVSDEQIENVAGGNKEQSGQVSLNNPVADLNEDGNVTLHEVVTYNRDQRDKR